MQKLNRTSLKNNITLIGMPAVGKSTVGNLLAQKIGFNFLDTDDLIQSKKHFPELFWKRDLTGFYKLKKTILSA